MNVCFSLRMRSVFLSAAVAIADAIHYIDITIVFWEICLVHTEET